MTDKRFPVAEGLLIPLHRPCQAAAFQGAPIIGQQPD